jgi:hypothetical protein
MKKLVMKKSKSEELDKNIMTLRFNGGKKKILWIFLLFD